MGFQSLKVHFFILEIIIPRATKNKENLRIYDKKHYCFFRAEPQTKISRHHELKHKNEEQVKALARLDTKERIRHLDKLRFLGDFHHNLKVLKVGGVLVVWRRPGPNDIVKVDDYIPCEYCLAFLTKKELWRHGQRCQFRDSGKSNSVKRSMALLYPNQCPSGASKELQVLILDNMNSGELASTVKKDELILSYGSFQLSTNGLRKASSISQRMRILARLLIVLKRLINADEDLKYFCKPEYFDAFINASKQLGEFSLATSEGENVACFSKPSLPLKIGYTVEKCAKLLKAMAIKRKDCEVEQNATRFNELYQLEWSVRIAAVGLRSLADTKFAKIQLLPVTEDLLKLRSHVKLQILELTKQFSEEPKLEVWRALAECVGSRLTIFNRRRSNEVYQLLVSRYLNSDKWKAAEMPEIKDSLTALEKRLMDR